jgi:hypothetical protein
MPENLFPSFDTVISLGYNCFPKLYINRYVKSSETQIFDYLGTPVWALNKLIENKWEGLTDSTKFTPHSFFDHKKNQILAHDNYHICFPHDVKQKTDFDSPVFKDKIQRRIQRFEETVRNSSRLLFIRLTIDKYVKHDEAEDTPEQALEKFVTLIKTTYECPSVTVIYINSEKDGWNNDHTILFVKVDAPDDINIMMADKVIHDLFKEKGVYSTLA